MLKRTCATNGEDCTYGLRHDGWGSVFRKQLKNNEFEKKWVAQMDAGEPSPIDIPRDLEVSQELDRLQMILEEAKRKLNYVDQEDECLEIKRKIISLRHQLATIEGKTDDLIEEKMKFTPSITRSMYYIE